MEDRIEPGHEQKQEGPDKFFGSEGYCSWCLRKMTPELVEWRWFPIRNGYRCSNCKRRLVECRWCKNYARYDRFAQVDEDGKVRKAQKDGKDGDDDLIAEQWDQSCGEHSHDVANFETSESKLESPDQWEKVYAHRCVNMPRAVNVTLVGLGAAVVCAPVFFIAGPAIGGAIGGMMGLQGAAAVSAGLAWLGGGAIAAGGLGMAGGTAVLTVFGAGVGGAAGAYLGNTYLRDVAGFGIRRIREGKQPAVITVNGFLTGATEDLSDWKILMDRHYPDREWFHVDWEPKTLLDLGGYVAAQATFRGFVGVVKAAAMHAAKAAAKVFGAGFTAVQALSLAANPWHVALKKASMTGTILADILRRCEGRSFVLLGHSLGARVIYNALTTLSTTGASCIDEVHLMGGAVDNDAENWMQVCKAVRHGGLHNYRSLNDRVLQLFYRVGTFFQEQPIGRHAIGCKGIDDHDVTDLRPFPSGFRFWRGCKSIVDHDVTELVDGHMSHKAALVGHLKTREG